MPVDPTTTSAARVRTHYELRQIVQIKGAAAFVSRRYFDEDEKDQALHQRDAWTRVLPEVGTQLTMSTAEGNSHTDVVLLAIVELYQGKVEITGASTWKWITKLSPVEDQA